MDLDSGLGSWEEARKSHTARSKQYTSRTSSLITLKQSKKHQAHISISISTMSSAGSSNHSIGFRRSEQLIPVYGTIQLLRESEPEEWLDKDHVILLEDDFAGLRAETTLFQCTDDDLGDSSSGGTGVSSSRASSSSSRTGIVKGYSRTKCSLLSSEVWLLLDQHFQERKLKRKDKAFLDAVFHNRVSDFREENYHRGWRSL